MGQSSVGSSPNPNQTQPKHKQKVIIAVVAVLVAHVGALWALANMPPMQLRPIEPTPPVKVKFVKIVEKPLPEPPKPEPPKPKPEPPKEKPKPKKVQIAEKPKEPPKKKEKVQQVKEKAPDKKVEMPPAETKVTTSTSVKETVKEQPKKEEVKEEPKKVDTSPRNLGDAASVAWKSKPKPRLKAKDLEDVTNPMVVVRIDVDETGRIKARIKQSSGSPKVDKEVIRAVQAARFHPYTENGVAMPFYAEQPFQLQ